uniref:Solute carrier organic anion transporter family member n=1 Tax=Schmidtea mediterranea TaxID=79327 RepID=A0A0H3YFC4_SCHMD|nr:slc21a-2 [Schmidtea mediterranea]
MKLSKFQITNPKIALVVMAFFSIFSGATVTYISAILTTIEKRFEFNSMEMGALLGANDIGYLTSVMFVAYFGSKKHRQPVMLCLSSIGLWLSCMTYSLPYFIFGSKFEAKSLQVANTTDQKGLCLNYTTETLSVIPIDKQNGEISPHEKSLGMFVLMIAGIINGVASTPFWSLGISFIDDMTGSTKSGIYIGTLYAMRTCAPVFGFLLGSHLLKYHESLQIMVSQYAPGQKDIKWIGAWWIGWLILGFCVLIPAPFMLLLKAKKHTSIRDGNEQYSEFLPKTEPSKNGNVNKQNQTKQADKIENKDNSEVFFFHEIKEMFRIIRYAFKNVIFSSLIVGTIFEIISFVCLLTFFTKYLEYHFRVSTSMTNVMTAICLSGSSVISASTSGITSHFYKTTMRNMNRYHAIVNTIAALMFPILFVFTCPSTEIAGLSEQSKLSMCSDKCNCQITKLEPVCFNSSTYFSPCIAGCTKQWNESFYGNCGCQNSLFAKKGFCEKMCVSVYGFLVAFVVIRIVGSIASVQMTQVLMRLTNPKTKAVNLSIISFLFGICGLVLPPLAGMVLDTACLRRNTNRFGGKSHCLIYDNNKMRHLILSVAFVLQIPACILYIIAWLKTPKDYVYKDHNDKLDVISAEIPMEPRKGT